MEAQGTVRPLPKGSGWPVFLVPYQGISALFTCSHSVLSHPLKICLVVHDLRHHNLQ